MNSGTMGYDYLYPLDGGERKEYVLSLSPDNLANFIGTHGLEAEKNIVTDILERLVVDTRMWFLDNCPNRQLCIDLILNLVPIPMGEAEPGAALAINRELANDYFQEEDQSVTMAELAMQ